MDMSNGIDASQNVSSSEPVKQAVSETSVSNNTQSAPVERTFRQSDIDEIVKKVKSDVARKYESQAAQQPSIQNTQQVQNSYAPNEENFRRIAAEEAARMRDTWLNEARAKTEAERAQHIVNTFWQKVNAGKEKYADFDKVTGDIELGRFPNTVQLLSEYIDNSGDVLYELGKDRFKMAQLESLAERSPRDAIIEGQRLAQSLKDNAQAAKLKLPNEPLSQMRPSGIGTDSGVASFADLRAKYRG